MKTRSGSALLVVLGMLSFMIVSGLAFSVYMRTTRLPASFTRRAVTTRQLAKAALAEAIDAIDRAVANDPHPNIRRNGVNKSNFWLGRVLVSSDTSTGVEREASEVVNSMESDSGTGDSEATVPVLSLEALAYLPPALINEARYYGQRTPTAAWKSFDFDAGRYAFIALDVSDYFDLNRMCAGEARSSDPVRRVTLNHLFDTADHDEWEGGASDWKSFLETTTGRSSDTGSFSFNKLPFVSLADFNLALGEQTISGFKSPFVQYVKNGNAGSGFYNSTPEDEGGPFWKYAQMTFVTDSIEAPLPDSELKTADGETILDLDDDANQPFTESFLNGAQRNRTMRVIFRNTSNTVFDRLYKHNLSFVGLFALSDYLDRDRIPISLGMPTVERVPMICGIKPELGTGPVKVTITDLSGNADEKVSGQEGTDPTIVRRRTVHWRLDPASLRSLVTGGNGVKALAVYPFRNHEKESENDYFQVDGKVQLFLSKEAMRLRTGNSDDLLHWGAGDSGDAESPGSAKFVGNSVFNFPLQQQTVSFNSSQDPQNDCVKLVDLSLDRESSTSLILSSLKDDAGDILRVTYEWTLTATQQDQDGTYRNYQPTYANAMPTVGSATGEAQILTDSDHKPAGSVLPLQADGTVVDSAFYDNVASSPKTDIPFYLNAVVTLRVTSSQAEVRGASSGTATLDMVPATIYDDELMNGVDNADGRMRDISGDPTPLMKFDTGVTLTVNPQKSNALSQDVAISPAAVMVADPRYNHAPENWKLLSNFSEQGWYDEAKTLFEARDGDIFMATSDQNYLQSVYEIGFLPRFSDLQTCDDDIRGNLPGYPDADSSWTQLGEKTPIDQGLMWKTYDIFGRYSDAGDDFEKLGLGNFGRGLRVNPYSDSTNIIMAAFANTPQDWRAASDDDERNPAIRQGHTTAEQFNKKHAWNEYSTTGTKLSWDALSAAAGKFMGANQIYAVAGNGDWRDALLDLFDQNRAYDTEKYLCGIKLEDFPCENGENSPIYSVDKKFLYGYWHNCFSVRQQLYLVFIRAEPMMLGGGVAGVTPPQLGAKAVAVVWRNPYKTTGAANVNDDAEGYVPHQSRILFYKQFE